MLTLLNSSLLVFISEMGDKTQLLAIMLTARFRRPGTILAGVLVATLLNHALASWAGTWIAGLVNPNALRWILALTFFFFAGWLLIPDKPEPIGNYGRRGAFFTTTVAFFLAEMGDKTQLATVALGAHYPNVALVTLGSTLGMLASNALAVFLGHSLLQKVPMRWVRRVASVLFLLFGIGILLKA